MTDHSRKEQLELRLAQSIRLLKQVDDPTTRERLHELTKTLETEKEQQETHEKGAAARPLEIDQLLGHAVLVPQWKVRMGG